MEIHEKNIKHEVEEKVFMQTFSSQEEAEIYRLKKNINRTDMEKFQMLCKMIRIGKMLSPAK